MPFVRFCHCIVPINRTYILLFGGFNEANEFEPNIMAFDSVRMEWEELSSVQELPCKPPPLGFQTSCSLVQ